MSSEMVELTPCPAEVLAIVLRHPKERRSKCSVEPLVGDPRFRFVRFDPEVRYQVEGSIVLSVGAPPLTPGDRGHPFLILDSTWRYLPRLRQCLRGTVVERALPASLRTAYPRVSKIAEDPMAGLASVEALYAALRVVGTRDDSLLDRYHWRLEFLEACESAGL
ncbi:MAG: hypothetical protein KDC38_15215 [Planctomycetes bacterium]|nr:hypothetical protein [Planctomycetota bacterium]